MRDRMERFMLLPFSVGCLSQSSVTVSDNTHPKKSHADSNPSRKASLKGDHNFDGEKTKSSSGFLPGLHRLVKGIKGIPQLFAVVHSSEEEEEEAEMEIGFPTDVKHVAHIGWDGTTGVDPAAKGSWDLRGAPEMLPLPSISFRQFELAMAAQADAPLPSGPVMLA